MWSLKKGILFKGSPKNDNSVIYSSPCLYKTVELSSENKILNCSNVGVLKEVSSAHQAELLDQKYCKKQ